MPLPAFVPITAERVRVRPFAPTDLPDLLGVNGDPRVTGFLPYRTWQTLADGDAWMQRMNALEAGGSARQLVVELRDEPIVIGSVLVFRFEEAHRRAELGYVLGHRHWHRGLMREALQRTITHLFSALDLRRLEAEVNPSHTASNALLQRLGFTHEGTLRRRWVGASGAYDTNLYGLLSDDPRDAA